MSFKKTLVFFILLLLLGSYYYLVEVRLAGKKQALEEARKKLFQTTVDSVREIRLKRADDQEIVLQKQANVWRLIQPVAAAADGSTVQSLLTAVSSAQRDKMIAEKSANDQEFGLDKPEIVVTLKTQADGAAQRLTIGKETPTASGCYARIGDAPAIITIPASVKANLDKTLYELRDKTILAFEAAKVKQMVLTLKLPDLSTPQAITLEQTAEHWTILAPKAYQADAAKIGSFLAALQRSQIKAFIAEAPPDLAQYGLDQPETTLTLRAGTEQPPETLLIGKSDAQQGDRYAKRAAAGNVFVISAELADALPKNLNDLRDKTLLTFTTEKLQKIEITSATETVVLERSGFQKADAGELQENTPRPPSSGEWQITQPTGWKADQAKIVMWLAAARNVKVEQFLPDDAANLAAYGLEAPQLKLSVWEEGQPQPQQLWLGRADAQQTGIYAKLGDSNAVVLVKADALPQLAKTAFDLRYRKILAFDSEQIVKLQVITHPKPLPGGESTAVTLLMEKDGNRWQATAPEKQELLAYKVNTLLYDLAALEFQEEILTPAADGGTYGFNEPGAEITLWAKGDQTGTILQIGKKLAGKDVLYAKTSAGATVYAIPGNVLNDLPQTLQNLAE